MGDNPGMKTKAGARPVRAPRGTELSCKGWQQEAALRMLMNNLDPEVAEDPDNLIRDLEAGFRRLGHAQGRAQFPHRQRRWASGATATMAHR